MAARDHERVALVTVDRMQRDAREVERGEHVGVAELGGEGEADKIERAERAVPVDGELRDPVRTHERLEIRPHGVRTLGERVVALVEDFVEDLHALVGHAHLVGVRVHERPVDGNGVPVLAHGVELAADVLDRLGHQGQQRLETREHGLDAHRWGGVEPPGKSPHDTCRHREVRSSYLRTAPPPVEPTARGRAALYSCARRCTLRSRPIASHEANIEVPP